MVVSQTDLEIIERGRQDYGQALALMRGADAYWHRTSAENLKAILSSGQLNPNDGRYASPWGVYFGRSIGGVCLFDFDTATEDEALLSSLHWGSFLTDQAPATVWICIPRTALELALIETPFALADRKKMPDGHPPKFFPFVEAWHRGPISTSIFSRYLAFGDPERTIEHEAIAKGPDAVAEITAIGAKWTERQRIHNQAVWREMEKRYAAIAPDPEAEARLEAARQRLKAHRALASDEAQ